MNSNNVWNEIYDLKNYDYFEIKKNLSINKILIDEKKRYFISAEDDYFIKFRDLNEIINKISEKNYSKTNISFQTLFEFKHNRKIVNVINLEKNLLGISDEKSINIYKYDVDNKTSQLIQSLEIKGRAYILKLIKRKDRYFLSSYFNSFLNIYEIPSLITKNTIKIQKYYNSRIVYEQINENELIIGENNLIKIINMNNDKCNYITKINNSNITSIKVLKDRTILIGGRGEIKRLFAKTLEELPCLISFNDYFDYNEDYYDYTGLNLMNFHDEENDVLFINELSDGKIILGLTYHIEIYDIKLNDILTWSHKYFYYL